MLLVEPQDPEGIAEAVARLAPDGSATPAEFLGLRARLEAGATALAAEFSWERIARQTAALFRRL